MASAPRGRSGKEAVCSINAVSERDTIISCIVASSAALNYFDKTRVKWLSVWGEEENRGVLRNIKWVPVSGRKTKLNVCSSSAAAAVKAAVLIRAWIGQCVFPPLFQWIRNMLWRNEPSVFQAPKIWTASIIHLNEGKKNPNSSPTQLEWLKTKYNRQKGPF